MMYMKFQGERKGSYALDIQESDSYFVLQFQVTIFHSHQNESHMQIHKLRQYFVLIKY